MRINRIPRLLASVGLAQARHNYNYCKHGETAIRLIIILHLYVYVCLNFRSNLLQNKSTRRLREVFTFFHSCSPVSDSGKWVWVYKTNKVPSFSSRASGHNTIKLTHPIIHAGAENGLSPHIYS